MRDEDPLVIQVRLLIQDHGERAILKALLETPIGIGYAEKLVSGRGDVRPRGANRNILQAFVEGFKRAS